MERIPEKGLAIDDRHLSIVPSNFYVAVGFLHHQPVSAWWVVADPKDICNSLECYQISGFHIKLMSCTAMKADDEIMPSVLTTTKATSILLTFRFTYNLQRTFIICHYPAVH